MAWWGGKKRSGSAAALEAARARVEALQRALLPYASAFDGPLRMRLQAAEQGWQAARAGEEDVARALAGYAEVEAQLAALLRELARTQPALVERELCAAAEKLLAEVEPGPRRCHAALQLLDGVLASGDAALIEARGARALALLEEEGLDQQVVEFVRLLYLGERLGPCAPLQSLRARAAALLHAGEEGDLERESWRHALLETQAEANDVPAVRATLARLRDEYEQQGLVALAEAQAQTGDLAGARASLARVRPGSLRLQGEAGVLVAEARAGRWSEVLGQARALTDAEARARVLTQLAALRARAGERAAAAALLEEMPPEAREEAELELLEAELERADLAAAEARAEELQTPEGQMLGWSRVADEILHARDLAAALALTRRIPVPFARARALQHLAWAGLARAPAEESGAEARARLEEALAIAADVVRGESEHARHPRGLTESVDFQWILLAARIQATLGDSASALACLDGLGDRTRRAEGLLELGRACGVVGDLAGLERLLAGLASASERTLALHGARAGVGLLRRLRAT